MNQQILEAEDAYNQKIANLILNMSDVVDFVVDVKQFATIAQLKAVLEEANHLMRKVVDLIGTHKRRGTLGKCQYPSFSWNL